ncbi:hypothetical protein ABZ934_30025 [Streptomyces sp. NPDC046557]|uniref:hypothetical protein n=1 Tax=Streptomyces sp. NPDC046557 TaxID=3155372 RepID=UPI0033FB92C5
MSGELAAVTAAHVRRGGEPRETGELADRLSWGDIFSTDVYKPDYSPQSVIKSNEDIEKIWSDTKDTVTSTGKVRSMKDLLEQAQSYGAQG